MTADEISRLVNTLDSSPDESQPAKGRLIELGPAVVEPLIEVVLAQQGRKAWNAAEVLGRLGDRRAAPSLIAALSSPNPMLGSAAAKALYRLSETSGLDVFPALAEALPHAPFITQQTIVMGLPTLKDCRAVEVLLDHLERTESPMMRCAIIQALGRLEDPQVAPALRRYLKDEDRHVRAWASEVLQRLDQTPDADASPAG